MTQNEPALNRRRRFSLDLGTRGVGGRAAGGRILKKGELDLRKNTYNVLFVVLLVRKDILRVDGSAQRTLSSRVFLLELLRELLEGRKRRRRRGEEDCRGNGGLHWWGGEAQLSVP